MKTTFILSGALLFSAFSFGQTTSATTNADVEAKTAVNASAAGNISARAIKTMQNDGKAGSQQAKTVIHSQKEQASATTTTKAEMAKNSVNGEITSATATPASAHVNAEKDNNIGLNTSLKEQSASSKPRPSVSAQTTASSAHSVQVKPVQVHSQVTTAAAVRIK